MKYLYLFFILLIMPLTTHADVYMQTDPNGTVIYSDTPINKNAKKLDTPEINTSSSSPSNPVEENQQATPVPESVIKLKVIRKPYTTFIISSPADQETIQNQPSITVFIKIIPGLQEEDTIQIYLDGSPWGNPLPATEFIFTAPDRGIHQISAKVMDKNGQVLKETPSNTVYIHQAHLGPNPPPLKSGM